MRQGWLRRRILWYFKRPQVVQAHQKRYGECLRCGHCCGHCIFYNRGKSTCRIYKFRPEICKAFPLTPHDTKDAPACGYTFKDES
jgi:hypothetical protein